MSIRSTALKVDNILVRKNSKETNKERGREIKAIKKYKQIDEL